jgi:hypothetical protein
MGVFARIDFAPGDSVFVLKGTIRRFGYDDKFRMGPRWIGVGDRQWIDPARTYGGFLNHSCDANAVITARRSIMAVKPIRAGEEVTIDYSTTEVDPFWQMTCGCGQPRCRKVIRGVQSLPAHVYERFRPYLGAFVKRGRSGETSA